MTFTKFLKPVDNFKETIKNLQSECKTCMSLANRALHIYVITQISRVTAIEQFLIPYFMDSDIVLDLRKCLCGEKLKGLPFISTYLNYAL